MVRTKSTSEREKTAKLIAKTSASIRKKHRALKTGIMENEIVLEKQLKPIIEPFKQIGNTERGGKPFETKFMENKQKNKREHSDDEDDDDDNDDDDNDAIPHKLASSMEQTNKKETIKRHT